jgi:hypothetical protein
MSPIRPLYEKGVVWRTEDDIWNETFYDTKYTNIETEQEIETDEIPEGSKPVMSLTMYPPKGFESIDGVFINNEDNKKYTLDEFISEKPDISMTDTSKPQILIIHTHATESYNESG